MLGDGGVQARVAGSQPDHVAESRPGQGRGPLRLPRGRDGAGVGGAQEKGHVAHQGHPTIVFLGVHEDGVGADGADAGEPFLERLQVLAGPRGEDPGSSLKEGFPGGAEPALRPSRHGMAAEEAVRVGHSLDRPAYDPVLDAAQVGQQSLGHGPVERSQDL